jgi:hypothetical protein
VWLPQESEQRSMSARQIFEKDVEGVDWAEVVVANMDGPIPIPVLAGNVDTRIKKNR